MGRLDAIREECRDARGLTLIDNLLQLSRVSQAEMNLQDVDLSAEVALTDNCVRNP